MLEMVAGMYHLPSKAQMITAIRAIPIWRLHHHCSLVILILFRFMTLVNDSSFRLDQIRNVNVAFRSPLTLTWSNTMVYNESKVHVYLLNFYSTGTYRKNDHTAGDHSPDFQRLSIFPFGRWEWDGMQIVRPAVSDRLFTSLATVQSVVISRPPWVQNLREY